MLIFRPWGWKIKKGKYKIQFKKIKGMFNETKRKQTLLNVWCHQDYFSAPIWVLVSSTCAASDGDPAATGYCKRLLYIAFTARIPSGHISLIFSSAVLYVLYLFFYWSPVWSHEHLPDPVSVESPLLQTEPRGVFSHVIKAHSSWLWKDIAF